MTATGPVARPNALAACGIAAPLVFIAAVTAASLNHPGYDHLKNFISELGATGAPAAGLPTSRSRSLRVIRGAKPRPPLCITASISCWAI
jgi:hypothetical protein